jgi:toxin-antitoxin system PIN domain toxin
MSAYLLDVNVLVALSWPGHEFHERAQRWFGLHANKGWATCPFTQAGFVRIVSNPAFSPRAVTPAEAIRALHQAIKHPRHEFWKDDLSMEEAVRSLQSRMLGHQQVTDAYLLGLALHKKGTLATLDRSILALVAEGSTEQGYVEIIR